MGHSTELSGFFSTTRRISLGLAVLKFIRAILTVYSVILSAKYFGASLERDTWILAGSAVTVLSQILFAPINEIFRIKFIHIRAEEGEESALASVNSLIYVVIGMSLVVIALVEAFPDPVSAFFAPSFKGVEQETLSLMIRWIIPTLLLNEITLLWIAVLNAYHSYFIPDIYSLVSVFINVVCILILVPFIGIYSLIAANYIAIAALIMVLLHSLMKMDKRVLAWSPPKWVLIKPFVVTSVPFYIAFIVGNAQTTIEKILSTFLGVGSVSILDYARKFIDMPISVIVGVCTSVLAPTLAGLYSENKQLEFHRETVKFMRMLILGLIPFVALFSVCAKELVQLLLTRGSFKSEFVDITAQSSAIFCLGTVGYIIFVVGSQSLIARKKASSIAVIASTATALGTIMNLLLFRTLELLVFPLSWGISMFLAGLYMVYCQKHNYLETYKEISKMIGMLLLVIVFCYYARLLSVHWLYESVAVIKQHDFLVVATTALIGNILYFCTIYLLDIEEMSGIKRFIHKRLKLKMLFQ